VSVVTNHHRSNSRAIATAKRVHPISSDIVLGLFKARLSLPHSCRQNFSPDCRPWLGKVRLTMFSLSLPLSTIASGPVRNESEEGRLFPCLSVSRLPHQAAAGAPCLSADPKQRVQVLRWLCLQHQPSFSVAHAFAVGEVFSRCAKSVAASAEADSSRSHPRSGLHSGMHGPPHHRRQSIDEVSRETLRADRYCPCCGTRPRIATSPDAAAAVRGPGTSRSPWHDRPVPLSGISRAGAPSLPAVRKATPAVRQPTALPTPTSPRR